MPDSNLPSIIAKVISFLPVEDALVVCAAIEQLARERDEAVKKWFEEGESKAMERVADFMISKSIVTGHGDTLDALLGELGSCVDDLRAKLAAAEVELKQEKVISEMNGNLSRGHLRRAEAAEARAESLEADKRILDWLLEAENADILLIVWPGKKRLTTRTDINVAIAAQEGK